MYMLGAYDTRSIFRQWQKRCFVSYNELLKCCIEFLIFQQYQAQLSEFQGATQFFQEAQVTYGYLLVRASYSDQILQTAVGQVEKASASYSRAVIIFVSAQRTTVVL